MNSNYKENVSNYIYWLMNSLECNQTELAKRIGIKQGRLSAYVTKKELPKADILLELAKLGKTSVEDVMTFDRSIHDKKDLGVTHLPNNSGVMINGSSNNSNINVGGDQYINTSVKRTTKYSPQEGDLTPEQANRLQGLVNEIVDLESKVKNKPKSHQGVWGAVKRKFKVTYYREIPSSRYLEAESYLLSWKGRLISTKTYVKNEPDEWRKQKYKSIFAIAKTIGMSKDDVDNLIIERHGKESIRELDQKELQSLYLYFHRMKKGK